MKRSIVASLALASLLLAPAIPALAAAAPSIDQADTFYSVCQKDENLDACSMYMAGYSTGELVQAAVDRQRVRYCVPPNLTRKDQLAVVMGYLRANLGDMLQPTGVVIYKAMLTAYPCR
jgi:hypothetical protein